MLAAYGWADLTPGPSPHVERGDFTPGPWRTPEGDEELLRRLLALNLERAARSR